MSSRANDPNHPLYRFERTLDDILANLHTIELHAKVSQDHADNADLRYPEDSLNQIYIEMQQQLKEIKGFKAQLLEAKAEVLSTIQARGQEETGKIIKFKRKAS